jgi:hypothetical protein
VNPANFAEWLCTMVELHVNYVIDQTISLAKIASYDAQIFWCNCKIVWYS